MPTAGTQRYLDLPLFLAALRSPAARTWPLKGILCRAIEHARFLAVDRAVVDQLVGCTDLDHVREFLSQHSVPPVPSFVWIESVVDGARAGMLVARIDRPTSGAAFCGLLAADSPGVAASFPLATAFWKVDDAGAVVPLSITGAIHARPPSPMADELVARLSLPLLAALASVTHPAVAVEPVPLTRAARRDIRKRLGLYLAGDVGRRVTLAEGSGT